MRKYEEYYRPEIEEFHVGFQCEWRLKELGIYTETSAWALEWQEHTITLEDFSDHDNAPEFPNLIFGKCEWRVKYLDYEQLEEIGFKEKSDKKDPFTGQPYYFRNNEIGFNTGYKEYLTRYGCDRWYYIQEIYGSWDCIEKQVHLRIKNISEFNKLMKQIL
jgi:hypothetical protein